MRKVVVACFVVLVLLPGSAKGSAEEEPFGHEPPAFGWLLPAAHAFALTTGPDGNVWFTGPRTGGHDLIVGKVTPSGEVTEYPQPSSGYAYSIATGPDGNLWFVESGRGAIGRIAPDGEATSFPLPDPESRPTAITAGPDGNLWFTEGGASRIGSIAPTGQITEFALPAGRHPGAITAGADGNLWFTERAAGRIGRITTSGQVTEFPIPGPAVKLGDIVAGPDGNIWFAEEAAARIDRITPRGLITQFGIPTSTGAQALISGPEGRLWFAAGDVVGAISTSGAISWPACLLPDCPESPAALTVGPEGGLWVATDYRSCKVCGGETAIELALRPGGIGRYELAPVGLGIGPRATPIRNGATSLLLHCDLPGGCRGQLRLTKTEWIDRKPRESVLGKGPYSLRRGETRRVPVPLFRRTLEKLREGDRVYSVRAEAGPPGAVEARRGSLVLALAGHRDG
jgi:streptogramin lyase